MPTLVEQIQREALNENVSVASLLRKVKLAAMKLGLDKIEDWVQYELNGYPDKVPEYRQLRGQPIAFNPMRGWIPLTGDGIELLSIQHVGQPISGIEDALRQSNNANMHIPFSPQLVSRLDRSTNYSFGRYSLSVGRGQVASVVDAVRTAVLDWAMNLERAGITGSEFSFTSEEKLIAKEPSVSWNIGNIGSLNGSIGTGNTTGNISVRSIDIDQSRDLSRKIRDHAPDLIGEGVPQAPLLNALSRLEAAYAQPEPDHSVIHSLWTDLRNVVSGAGGGLVSTGVLTLIGKLFGG